MVINTYVKKTGDSTWNNNLNKRERFQKIPFSVNFIEEEEIDLKKKLSQTEQENSMRRKPNPIGDNK